MFLLNICILFLPEVWLFYSLKSIFHTKNLFLVLVKFHVFTILTFFYSLSCSFTQRNGKDSHNLGWITWCLPNSVSSWTWWRLYRVTTLGCIGIEYMGLVTQYCVSISYLHWTIIILYYEIRPKLLTYIFFVKKCH